METGVEFNNRFKVPPGFRRVEFEANDLNEECLEDDDEIILIKAPHKESTTHYETSFTSDLPEQFKSYNVLIPTGKEEPGRLQSISKKISGYLVISEDVDIPEWEAPPIVEKHVPFPEGLKYRFTPFGAEGNTSKSKRKKNKSRIENEEKAEPTICGSSPEKSRFEVENDVTQEKMTKKDKKKKKKRHSDDETEDTQSSPEKKNKLNINESSDSPDKHKKKKKKKNDESLQEKTLLDNLMISGLTLPSGSPKKEMKKKKGTEWPSYIESSPSNKWNSKVMDESIFSEDLNESEGKKRKKKKLKTKVESNAKVETSVTEDETKKKKKPKEKSLTENENNLSKKKKKKSS